jgi:hypothetical protein
MIASITGYPEIVIDVEGLTKAFYGRTLVKRLTMQVRRGLIYGFPGPNGSGKNNGDLDSVWLSTPDAELGICLGYDICTWAGRIKCRLCDVEVLTLGRFTHSREPRVRCSHPHHSGAGLDSECRNGAPWAQEPCRPASGRTLGWLETASGVPIPRSLTLLGVLTVLFVLANLSVENIFSTIPSNQL